MLIKKELLAFMYVTPSPNMCSIYIKITSYFIIIVNRLFYILISLYEIHF